MSAVSNLALIIWGCRIFAGFKLEMILNGFDVTRRNSVNLFKRPTYNSNLKCHVSKNIY